MRLGSCQGTHFFNVKELAVGMRKRLHLIQMLSVLYWLSQIGNCSRFRCDVQFSVSFSVLALPRLAAALVLYNHTTNRAANMLANWPSNVICQHDSSDGS